MVGALLFLYAESPVHAGAASGLGDLDLPIQREAGTGFPVVWGQSLKGALRGHARTRWGADDSRVASLFGDPPPTRGTAEAAGQGDAVSAERKRTAERPAGRAGERAPLRPGRLSIGDAQLVAFPVPTLRETFAWVTSPLALGRLRRRIRLLSADTRLPPAPGLPAPTAATALAATEGWAAQRAAVGPYVLGCEPDDQVLAWAYWLARVGLPADEEFAYFRTKLGRDLIAVADALLALVSRDCAEVTPRVQLNETEKTVNAGPFHTEYLPTETLLVSLLEATDAAAIRELDGILTGQILHLGGDETIGKGLMWGRIVGLGGTHDTP